MFNTLKHRILRKLYRFLILKTIVLDRQTFSSYGKLKTFCSLDISTNKGVFTFIFKEDRRRSRRRFDSFFMINNFLVELAVPEYVTSIEKQIENKIIIVVKIMIFKVNYEILAEVLADVYLDVIIEFLSQREHTET